MTRADTFAAGSALEEAYEHRMALLTRATRLLEDVPSPVSGAGQPTVDEGAPVRPGAMVRVRLQSGSVRVIGWDHDSVHVTGRLAPGEAWVTVPGADTVVVRAEGVPRGLAAPSELEIRVPRGAPLVIRAAAASLVVRAIDGPLDVATAAGNLLVEEVTGPVRAETMQGTLAVVGPVPRLDAATASGALTVSVPLDTITIGEDRVPRRRPGVTGAFGPVTLRTVSGRLVFDAPAVERGGVHSVRGDMRLAAEPVPGGVLQATSHAGLTTIAWPDGATALLDAASIRGGVSVPARGTPEAGRLVVRSVRGDITFTSTP
jgi:hypothetical protein